VLSKKYIPSDGSKYKEHIFYQKLQDEDCVSMSYKKAQRIIMQYAHSSDGYRVLEQLLRFVHPNLQQVTSNTYDVPKISVCDGDVYEYGASIMHYILRQRISSRVYSDKEQSIMFLNNMDDDEYSDAKYRALAEIRHSSTVTEKLDPNMMLESLPTTISQYQTQMNGNRGAKTSKSRSTNFVRSLLGNEDAPYDDGDSVPQLRAFGRRREYQKRDFQRKDYNRRANFESLKQCKACGKWGCSETKCRFFAQVQLAVSYIRSNSSKTAKLAEEFLRTNSKKTKISTIRTLTSLTTSNSTGDDISGVSDESLLAQYDINIPMEDIDSSGSEKFE